MALMQAAKLTCQPERIPKLMLPQARLLRQAQMWVQALLWQLAQEMQCHKRQATSQPTEEQ